MILDQTQLQRTFLNYCLEKKHNTIVCGLCIIYILNLCVCVYECVMSFYGCVDKSLFETIPVGTFRPSLRTSRGWFEGQDSAPGVQVRNGVRFSLGADESVM